LKIGTERWTAQCHNSPADMNGHISDTGFSYTTLTYVIACMHNASSVSVKKGKVILLQAWCGPEGG